MPDRMLEDMSDRMPARMPDRMPDRMPEDMPDKMAYKMSEKYVKYVIYYLLVGPKPVLIEEVWWKNRELQLQRSDEVTLAWFCGV